MSSHSQTTEDRVLDTIAEVLGKKRIDLTSDLRLVEDLKVDSVDKFSILMGLEKDFDTEIPDEELIRFKTIGDIQQYVKSRGLSD